MNRLGYPLLAMLLLCAPARADKNKARDLFKRGMAAYTLEKYDRAIVEFEAGFQEEPDPVFLYNIAQAYRLSNDPARAIAFYRKYLKMSPHAVNREEVEGQIATLEKATGSPTDAMVPPGLGRAPVVVETQRAGVAPQAPTTTPTATGAPMGTSAPSDVGAASERPRLAAIPVEPGSSRPDLVGDVSATRTRRTWPIWVGVAAGVVLVGAAIALAIGLTRSSENILPIQSAQ